MVLRYSLHYLIARGIPALVNFLAIAVYTRLLSPDAYGRYILVLAGVNMANLTVFQWLRLSLVRYLPAYQEQEGVLLGTIGRIYLMLMAGVGVLGGLAAGLVGVGDWQRLVLVAVLLLWMQAWFELNVELLRARLQTRAYGWAMGVRSVGALGLGTLFILGGLGAFGPLLGMTLSMAGVGLFFVYQNWRTIRLQLNWNQFIPLLRFGLPLAGSVFLNLALNASDRFLIALLIDEEKAGIYSAGYDLAYQPIILLFSVVNLASYPLIVRAWENRKERMVKEYLSDNITLLLAIGFASGIFVTEFSDLIVKTVLGEKFYDATIIVPWIVWGTLLEGIRIYHSDFSFHLTENTKKQLYVVMCGLFVNLIVNLIYIPRMGMIAAAWSTLIALGCALLLSIWWGRRLILFTLISKKVIWVVTAGIIVLFCVKFLKSNLDSVEVMIISILLCLLYVSSVFYLLVRNIKIPTD
nr:oligosaccharide flippase family protein [Rhodothermus marinus]MBO2492399.1 polysaccharide biosynthesis protein [Rhodothermus marinus]